MKAKEQRSSLASLVIWRLMRHLAGLFIVIVIGISASVGQQMPKVHFNHVYLVIDSLALIAIKKSGFINNEFAAFSTRTTNADSGLTWTGSYMYGVDNYFEIFEPSADDSLGNAGIAFSVDSIGEIFKMDSILKNNYKTEVEVRNKEAEGKMVPWFTVLSIADSVFFSQTHIYPWLMEYKGEYFDYNHWTYQNNQLTRKDYLNHYEKERRNKILKKFTGVTLITTDQEREFFNKFLLTCGYKKTNSNTFISPDNFIFKFISRNKTDRFSIASLEFKATNSGNKTYNISEHIKIILNSDKGQIIFDSK